MSRTAGTGQSESAIVTVSGLPAGHLGHVSKGARGHRFGRRCFSTEHPRNEHLIRAAAGDTDQDSNLSCALGALQADRQCGHRSKRVMAQGKLERVEKHPGVYRRHVKDCPRQGRCQCAYVLVYSGRAETFRTLAEADEGKRLAQRQARLAKAHASGHHRGVPEAECPECERERAARESAGGTFEAFAAAWYAEHEHEWEQRTRTDYSWRLNSHLLPWFGARRPSEIDVDFVDRYKAHKLAESARLQKEWDAWHASRGEKPKARPLGPRTINMTLILLSAILDAAEERKLIERNPAAGKRRRVKERKPKRTQLDTATAIEALLFAAGELDAEAQEHPQSKVRLLPRRAIVATLLLSGPRIGELVDDRWADVDLANDRIQYDSKTPAGCRWVRLLPALHDELATLKAQRDPSPDDYVFGTARGGKQSESNIRNRVLSKAVERANEQLARAREAPLPHLTPHGCRRTFASIRYALGASPAEVMAELGHTNPSLALAVYAQAMRMSEKEKARLRALVEGTLGSLGSRWDQDDGRESPQIATIESAEANGRKAAGSRRKVGQP